jgi:hypothetical protein
VTQPLDYRRVLFFEEQRFPQVGVTLFLCGIGTVEIGVGLFVLVITTLFGRAPSRFHLFTELAAVGLGALTILLRFVVRLRVIVDCDGIRAGVHPMPLRKYPWKLFGGCEVRTYRALADHGGRGSARLRNGTGWAYTAWGDRGVALRLTQGQTLFIGSQVPEDLCAAIREALATPSGREAPAAGELTPPARSEAP